MKREKGTLFITVRGLLFSIKIAACVKTCLVCILFLMACNIVAAQTCTVVNSVPAAPPTSGVFDILVAAEGSADYLVNGTLIFDSYDIKGNGVSTAIPASNSFWQGPLERCGVWAKGDPLTMSYSICINIPEGKTYYIGFAADNSGTLTIDGNVILQGIDFAYWRIYKISLTKGKHIVEFSVVNQGGPAALGFEIYDNTEDQILNSNSYGDLNVIFSTQNEIGAPVQQADPATSYSCPVGFSLDYCESATPVCSQFVPLSLNITDPAPACTSTGVDITSPQITMGSPSSLTYTYWKDDLATVPLATPNNITTSGTYYIMGSSNGCSAIKPVNVIINSSTSTVNSVICQGRSYLGYSKSGTYIDTLQAANGCDNFRILNLTVKPIADTTIDITICRGDSYRGHTKSGMYQDTILTPEGCDSLVNANLSVSPDIDLGPDQQLCLGQTILLNPGPFKNYLWQDGSAMPTFNVTQAGIYWVKVTDENGCMGADTVVIKGSTCLSPPLPNTFTPNGDGINDTWELLGLQSFPECTVFIYDRWGQTVFKSTGYSKPWDGTYNGKKLPFGTYYYVIDLKNNTPLISGDVTIVR